MSLPPRPDGTSPLAQGGGKEPLRGKDAPGRTELEQERVLVSPMGTARVNSNKPGLPIRGEAGGDAGEGAGPAGGAAAAATAPAVDLQMLREKLWVIDYPTLNGTELLRLAELAGDAAYTKSREVLAQKILIRAAQNSYRAHPKEAAAALFQLLASPAVQNVVVCEEAFIGLSHVYGDDPSKFSGVMKTSEVSKAAQAACAKFAQSGDYILGNQLEKLVFFGTVGTRVCLANVAELIEARRMQQATADFRRQCYQESGDTATLRYLNNDFQKSPISNPPSFLVRYPGQELRKYWMLPRKADEFDSFLLGMNNAKVGGAHRDLPGAVGFLELRIEPGERRAVITSIQSCYKLDGPFTICAEEPAYRPWRVPVLRPVLAELTGEGIEEIVVERARGEERERIDNVNYNSFREALRQDGNWEIIEPRNNTEPLRAVRRNFAAKVTAACAAPVGRNGGPSQQVQELNAWDVAKLGKLVIGLAAPGTPSEQSPPGPAKADIIRLLVQTAVQHPQESMCSLLEVIGAPSSEKAVREQAFLEAAAIYNRDPLGVIFKPEIIAAAKAAGDSLRTPLPGGPAGVSADTLSDGRLRLALHVDNLVANLERSNKARPLAGEQKTEKQRLTWQQADGLCQLAQAVRRELYDAPSDTGERFDLNVRQRLEDINPPEWRSFRKHSLPASYLTERSEAKGFILETPAPSRPGVTGLRALSLYPPEGDYAAYVQGACNTSYDSTGWHYPGSAGCIYYSSGLDNIDEIRVVQGSYSCDPKKPFPVLSPVGQQNDWPETLVDFMLARAEQREKNELRFCCPDSYDAGGQNSMEHFKAAVESRPGWKFEELPAAQAERNGQAVAAYAPRARAVRLPPAPAQDVGGPSADNPPPGIP